jgi:hypothetical protein
MSVAGRRFVAKAVKGVGWRVWDNLQHRFWGPVLQRQPDKLLAELNGQKRGPKLEALITEARRAAGR